MVSLHVHSSIRLKSISKEPQDVEWWLRSIWKCLATKDASIGAAQQFVFKFQIPFIQLYLSASNLALTLFNTIEKRHQVP